MVSVGKSSITLPTLDHYNLGAFCDSAQQLLDTTILSGLNCRIPLLVSTLHSYLSSSLNISVELHQLSLKSSIMSPNTYTKSCGYDGR